MRRLTATLSIGVAFSAGMLVPLIGLHATESFRYLDFFGFTASPAPTVASSSVPDLKSSLRLPGRPVMVASRAPQDAKVQPPAATISGADEPVASNATRTGSDSVPPADSRPMAQEPMSQPPVATAPQNDAPVLTKAQIGDIQTLLAVHGFNAGGIDGLVGPQTREAIRQYDAAHGLPVTGDAGPALLASLESASAPRSAEPEVAAAAPVGAVSETESATAPDEPETDHPAPAATAGSPLQLIAQNTGR